MRGPDVRATAHAKVYEKMQEELATKKDDIVTVRASIDSNTLYLGELINRNMGELRRDIAGVREEFEKQGSSLIKWMVGTQFATIGIIVAVMGFLHM